MSNFRPLLVVSLVLSLQSGFSQTPAAPASDAGAGLSPAAADVVKMAQGVSDDVVLAYIQNSQAPYSLTADNVVYLKDIGVSSAVITAMINHDKSLPAQSIATYNQQLYTPAPGQPAVAAPAASAGPPPDYVGNPPADVAYFYNDLSPYGSWVDLDGYGWCWQPSVVTFNAQWRPYCDAGHWVYTDSGWFWQSDYSWGWAPFHYGRWIRHSRCGWVWFPDQVWGPAWVTWRTSGNDCGWAPLPLHATFDVTTGLHYNGVSVGLNYDFGLLPGLFTFVALNDFCQADLARHCLPPAEVTRVYNNTTIINEYVIGRNRQIVNNGIPVERVRQATRAPLQPVVVRNVPAGMRLAPGATAGGAVYRHELRAPTATVAIRAQKVDDRHPVIQHAAVAPSAERRVAPMTHTAPVAAATSARVAAAPAGHAAKTVDGVEIGEPIYLHGNPADSPNLPPRNKSSQAGAGPAPETNPRVYHEKGYKQSQEAHTLPPLNDPDRLPAEPAQPYPPGKNPHVYNSKLGQQSATAHALPPSNEPPSLSREESKAVSPPNPYKVTSPKSGGH